jgi:glycosyltransferase involved in cell wall biosynthesis
MRDLVIQLHEGEYHDFVRYLSGLEFEAVVLRSSPRRFHTMLQLLSEYFWGACQLLTRRRAIQSVRTIVVFSHFAMVVKLFARLGLARYERLFCFGFFLHNPRWFPIFRWLRRLDRAKDHYIIFSEAERDLYRTTLGIESERLHFIPLGDWRQVRLPFTPMSDRCSRGYYFAGGRSNRDYRALVEAFRTIPARLVIVCSKENLKELEDVDIPDNVTLECDVPIARFDELARDAKAGIIPLRHDTGSSGQSVALTFMRDGKCIIATKVAALKEYVEHEVSGFWMDDMERDLPAYIRRLEQEEGLADVMGRAARQRYEERFSLSIAMAAFENTLAEVSAAEETCASLL